MTTPAQVPDSFVLAGDGQSRARGVAAEIEQRRRSQRERDERQLGDYQRNSWRWNDVEALRYDLEMTIQKRNRARAIANGLGVVGIGGGAAEVGRHSRRRVVRRIAGAAARVVSPPVALAAEGAALLAAQDAERFDAQSRAIEQRLAELTSQR